LTLTASRKGAICRVAKRASDWAREGGVAALTFLYGHLVMPCCLQSFFSEVRHIPSCFATAFSGRCKYCVSSSIETTLCVGILALPGKIWPCPPLSLCQPCPNPRGAPACPRFPRCQSQVATRHPIAGFTDFQVCFRNFVLLALPRLHLGRSRCFPHSLHLLPSVKSPRRTGLQSPGVSCSHSQSSGEVIILFDVTESAASPLRLQFSSSWRVSRRLDAP
jgi:hypothetical protein